MILRARSLIIGCCIFVLLFSAGCTDSSPHQEAAPSTTLPIFSSNSLVERVEVYHFHGNRQCSSCIAVGDLAEETVETRFRDEVAFGRLVFAHINVELPENYDLAAKYGVTGSSLWIGVYDGSGFHKKEDVRVWTLIGNRDAYIDYLSGVLTRRLNGDLT
jgi:hypothetical protein